MVFIVFLRLQGVVPLGTYLEPLLLIASFPGYAVGILMTFLLIERNWVALLAQIILFRVFCEALSDAGLMDLVQLGSSFTYNYREGTDHCMREKLDRACSTIS